MTASARTSALPESTSVGALSAEAVRKLGERIHMATQRENFRVFSLSARLEASKNAGALDAVRVFAQVRRETGKE
jgi:hypothetical protein